MTDKAVLAAMTDFPYLATIGAGIYVYSQSSCTAHTDNIHRLILFEGDVLSRVLCVLVPLPIEEVG